MSNEERAAIIGGIFLVVGALIGYVGGKFNYIEISKYHSAELERQKELFQKQNESLEFNLSNEIWRAKGKSLHTIRQNIIAVNSINFENLEGLGSYLENILIIEKHFDDSEYYRFLSDYASKNQHEVFNKLMNKRSVAIVNLQKIVAQALLPTKGKININQRTKDLVQAINDESSASSAHFGFVISATVNSLSK